MITSTKLYVPFETLSINDKIKFLEIIKQVFKWKIYWNKFRSEITTQSKSNNLDCLIDPTFRNINRLFALSFQDVNDDHRRSYFNEYDMPLDNKLFLIRYYEKTYQIVKNINYTAGNLLDFSYHQNYYQFVCIDLLIQTKTSISH